MAKVFINLLKGLCVLITVFLISSCGSGGSSGTGGGTGTLQINLTDAATDSYQAIYVTIDEIQVKRSDASDEEVNWQTVINPEETFNLLELVNGEQANLGLTKLDSGSYGQLRLILGETIRSGNNILGDSHPYANYLIDNADDSIELKVPSGLQTGIKIVGGFQITSGNFTKLILDFDATKSVVQAGNSGKWLLKPTIKVLETTENSVSGIVDDGSNNLEGALVSAQTYNPSASDIKDVVSVEMASLTDENGSYKLFPPPGAFNIVAAKEGYMPACSVVEATDFIEYFVDFTLSEVSTADSGVVSGTINGLGAPDDSATLSFRQTIDCGNGDVEIEVLSINIAKGGTFTATLPVGEYHLVASAEGKLTKEYTTVDVLDSVSQPSGTEQNVTF